MPNALNNIETLVQRTLSTLLRDALPDTVTVTRALVPAPPEGQRVTVLPGNDLAVTEVPFIGNAGRAVRDDTFNVRVWVEVIGDDQDEVEDGADAYVATVENVSAEQPDLGGLDGVVAFGQRLTRMTHPMVELRPGVFYRWVELEISADTRLD